MTFLTRVAEMLRSRNPGAAELERDPYARGGPREPSLRARGSSASPDGAGGRASPWTIR